ncbi:MAG: FAD-dependent oxidoreductase [bacterium]
MARERAQTVVIGGGLAGLTASMSLARSGQEVVLIERAAELGGRATTQKEGEFLFNQGPHALYVKGVGEAILRDLGVTLEGGSPKAAGLAMSRGRLFPLPTDVPSLFFGGLLGFQGKLEIARAMTALRDIDKAALVRTTVRQWVEKTVWTAEARHYLYAVIRLATFANNPDQLSASVALTQLQRAIDAHVRYLDGGWQSLVDQLALNGRLAGVQQRVSTKVERVAREGAHWVLEMGPDNFIEADTVLLALPPHAASTLVVGDAEPVLRKAANLAPPVLVACLDLGLAGLPKPERTFALGMEQPFYYAVHSGIAELATPGYTVVQLAKYLAPNALETGPSAEKELEGVMDLVQPGWRDSLEERRYLPRMVVSGAVPMAQLGGLAGRPDVAVPGQPGLYLAGDWIGPEGILAEASLSSARRAAEAILEAQL